MEEGVKGYFEFLKLPRYQNLRGIRDPEVYLKTIFQALWKLEELDNLALNFQIFLI